MGRSSVVEGLIFRRAWLAAAGRLRCGPRPGERQDQAGQSRPISATFQVTPICRFAVGRRLTHNRPCPYVARGPRPSRSHERKTAVPDRLRQRIDNPSAADCLTSASSLRRRGNRRQQWRSCPCVGHGGRVRLSQRFARRGLYPGASPRGEAGNSTRTRAG